MKICMFSNLFPPVVSGSSTQSSALSRELVARGHDVCVITAQISDDTPEFEVVDGVYIYRLPAIRLPKMAISLNFPWLSITLTPSNQRRIAKIIEEFKPDLLHLHNHMFDLAFSARRMSKRFNLPLVTTLHTVIKHANPLYNIVLYPADRMMLRLLIINNSDKLIYPDVNIEEYAVEAFGAADNRGGIVPYGINLAAAPTEPKVQELCERFGLTGKRIILSLGHVHEIRNRKDIVEALPYVLKEMPNTVLLIVGTVATDTPRQIAEKLGVQGAVIFAGAAPHNDVPAYLKLADMEAHWLNQEDPEKTSLGIASLEAMSTGNAILSAANPNTYGADVLKDGENILMVKPGNPKELARTIVDLLQDDEKRKAIGENARKTIEEHFSWESVCRKTVTIYEQAIEQRLTH